MVRISVTVASMGFSLLSVSPSFAQASDAGNDYLPLCKLVLEEKAKTDLFGQGQCFATVKTVMQMNVFYSPVAKLCVPPGVTYPQALRVVVRFLENNPDKLHFSFSSLTMYALTEAWPCPK